MTEKLVLAIETSCDDTSVALVSRTGEVVSCVTENQFHIHAEFGGVFPELASRAHVEAIIPTLDRVMDAIGHDVTRIEAVAVTRGPGLIGSLLVGLNTATALAASWGKPIYGVNHLHGHIRSAMLEGAQLETPSLLLLVSGGHTLLAQLSDDLDITLLGQTRDDSIGECFDKVARMLGLGMPGGPQIDRLAQTGRDIYRFPRPMISDGYEFSFSGLKSSVARLLENEPDADPADVAASLVGACVDIMVTKCRRAIHACKPKSLTLVGGVAANSQLRSAMEDVCGQAGISLNLPPLKWATDNAAMIGMAAWDLVDKNVATPLEAQPNLALGTD